MNNFAKQVEQDIQKVNTDVQGVLTHYGEAILAAKRARLDAQEWMTKYKIEAEECQRLEKEVNNRLTDAEERATTYMLRMQKAERKIRILSNVIGVLIDSEEFV